MTNEEMKLQAALERIMAKLDEIKPVLERIQIRMQEMNTLMQESIKFDLDENNVENSYESDDV